jgi:hypothetical protein
MEIQLSNKQLILKCHFPNAVNELQASCVSRFRRNSLPFTGTSKRVINPDRATTVNKITLPRQIQQVNIIVPRHSYGLVTSYLDEEYR